jgi:hypothetical protein
MGDGVMSLSRWSCVFEFEKRQSVLNMKLERWIQLWIGFNREKRILSRDRLIGVLGAQMVREGVDWVG